jgi:anti-anti-sigma factor
MKLTMVAIKDGIVRVKCEGDITQADFLTEGNPFAKLLGAGSFASKVLLNMDEAAFIDSAGIGWLVMSHKSFSEGGGILVLYNIPPMVDHVFRLLHMPSVLNLAGNESAAVARATGGQP